MSPHPLPLTNTTLSNLQADYYPAVVSYVIRAQDIQSDGRVAASNFVTAAIMVDAEAPLQGGSFQVDSATVVKPCIGLTVNCTSGVGENGTILVCGTVTNCNSGNLTNVVVSNTDGMGTLTVTNLGTLASRASKDFCGIYVPLNPCVPNAITVLVTGTDTIPPTPLTVSASAKRPPADSA